MKYFNELIMINKTIMKKVNIRLPKEDLIFIDDLIKKLYILTNKCDNINTIIENLLNVVGAIWYMQPFYDGNTRTLKIFMKSFLKKININIDTNGSIIPILLEGDTVSSTDILKIKSKML